MKHQRNSTVYAYFGEAANAVVKMFFLAKLGLTLKSELSCFSKATSEIYSRMFDIYVCRYVPAIITL